MGVFAGYSAKVAVTFIAAIGAAGCSLTQTPSLPGLPNEINEPRLVSVATIVTALRCQIARGLTQIQALENDAADGAPPFLINAALGTFSGQTVSASQDGASMSIIFPVTSVTGSVLTPSISGTIVAQNTENLSLDFSVKTISVSQNTSICDSPALQDIDAGSFITQSLVAQYMNFIDARSHTSFDGASGNTFPSVNYKEIKINTNFVVRYTGQAGISSTFILEAAKINSISPGISSQATETGTYALNMRFFLGEPNEDAGKRILTCQSNQITARHLCVEKPYSTAGLTDAEAWLGASEQDGAAAGDSAARSLFADDLAGGFGGGVLSNEQNDGPGL